MFKIKRLLFFILAFLLWHSHVYANNDGPDKKQSFFVSRAISSVSSSQFTPPESKLGTYVTSSGSGLDTGCTYTKLAINLYVPNVLNDSVLDHDGKIKSDQVSHLVSLGTIDNRAQLNMPTYDIDGPEVDYVYFNGEYVAQLKGANNVWQNTDISIPIDKVKFGQNNLIEIDIDINNEGWCMSVDWVSIEFDVVSPIVLVHGINADASTWDRDTLDVIDLTGVRYQTVSLIANGTVTQNATLLGQKIQQFLEPLKASGVHIIAHSKGGLDAQYMAKHFPNIDVLTLSTFVTPHFGSVTADVRYLTDKYVAKFYENSQSDPEEILKKYFTVHKLGGPKPPGIYDLTTNSRYQSFIKEEIGNVENTYSFAADADLNGNEELENSEASGLFPWSWITGWGAKRAYNIMKHYNSVSYVTTEQVLIWDYSEKIPQQKIVERVIYQAEAQDESALHNNDIVVTVGSALPTFATSLGVKKANHSTVKNPNTMNLFINQIMLMRGGE